MNDPSIPSEFIPDGEDPLSYLFREADTFNMITSLTTGQTSGQVFEIASGKKEVEVFYLRHEEGFTVVGIGRCSDDLSSVEVRVREVDEDQRLPFHEEYVENTGLEEDPAELPVVLFKGGELGKELLEYLGDRNE